MAGKPDVRVKLSAEGVAEVVAALKKIQSEGQRATVKPRQSFLGFNNVLGATKNLLGGLGIALGINQFRSFIQRSVDAADSINKTGAKIGATTENLSALQLVARTADSTLESVAAAIVRMNKNLGDAAAGVPTAIGYMKDLGVELDDIRGLDAVEVFALISKKLMEIEDPLVRDRVALGLFGRAGAQVKPTMQALADEGLGSVIERARELGILLDHDVAAASERIKDDLEILAMQSEALGARFMAGFGPEASQALQVLSGDLSKTTDDWREAGEAIGKVVKWVVAVVATGFDLVGSWIGFMMTSLVSLSSIVSKAMQFDFRGAKQELQTFERWFGREWKDLKERVGNRFELAISTSPEAEGGEPRTARTGEGGQDPAELAAKRAQALQTALDRELSITKSATSLKTAAEKRAFEEGLKDVESHYADRRAIVDAAYDDEVRVLAEKRALLDDITDPGRRLQEEKKIDLELARARLEHENAIGEILFEERQTVRDLAKERLGIEQKILEAQGKRTEAQRLGFEEELRQADLILRKRGASDAEREATLRRLRQVLEAGADFEDAKADAEAALHEYDAARAEIEARAAAGLITQYEAETEILAIEQGRLGTLAQLAEALEAAALATGDPEKIAQAREFAASVREIGMSVEASTSAFGEFRKTALESATGAITDFLDSGISKATTLRGVFKNLASSIIGDLRRIAAQMLAQKFMGLFGGLFSGGGEIGADFIGPPVAGKAGGGLLHGPGTDTSDSILIRASRMEYLVKAASVRQPGVLPVLEAINAHGARALTTSPVIADIDEVAHFAQGGLVGSAGAEGGGTLNGRLLLGLEDGLVLRDMESPQGQRIMVQALAKHRRAARAALGI